VPTPGLGDAAGSNTSADSTAGSSSTPPPQALQAGQGGPSQQAGGPPASGSLAHPVLALAGTVATVPERPLPVLSSTAARDKPSWANDTSGGGAAVSAAPSVAMMAATGPVTAAVPQTGSAATTLKLPPGPLQAQLSNSTRPSTPASPPHHLAIQVAPSPASSTSLPTGGLSGVVVGQDVEQAEGPAPRGPAAGAAAGTAAGPLMAAPGSSENGTLNTPAVNGSAASVTAPAGVAPQATAGKVSGNPSSGLPPKVPTGTSRFAKDSNAVGAFGAGAAGAAAAVAALAAGGTGGPSSVGNNPGSGSHGLMTGGGVTGGGITGVTLPHTLTPIAESGPTSEVTGIGGQAERSLSHASYLQR
jgi:hypothetical protein